MDEIIELWKPIEFTDAWLKSDISVLSDLTPSWFRRRVELQEGNKDYEEFLERLKRQHAIETGVVEKLYDLSEGITETFIKEGFVESYLSHDDTNIPPQQLMGYLKDHFAAMDFIFDLVKNERPLTVGFIKQLHQLVTKQQEYIVAITPQGEKVQIKLLKGEFKQTENNPRREDGKIFRYCPPIHVASEMDKLIEIHTDLWSKNINPIIIASFVHHAFTQIHPFQDGNGRIARLIASLILIRGNLFPFTVRRDEKVRYIQALEKADEGIPQDLVSFFCDIQKRNIENALNYKSEKSQTSLEEIAKLFTEKVEVLNSRVREQRQRLLDKNREIIFEKTNEIVDTIKEELFHLIPIDKARIYIDSVYPTDDWYHKYTFQIGKYAKSNSYYFNKYLPRGYFKIIFSVSQEKKYELIISIHHYSYDDSVIAIGSFLEFTEHHGEENEERTTIPINMKPYTISLEGDSAQHLGNLNHYIRDVVKIGLTIIANEII